DIAILRIEGRSDAADAVRAGGLGHIDAFPTGKMRVAGIRIHPVDIGLLLEFCRLADIAEIARPKAAFVRADEEPASEKQRRQEKTAEPRTRAMTQKPQEGNKKECGIGSYRHQAYGRNTGSETPRRERLFAPKN